MLVMMIIGWLVTVACFLVYVRRLRNIIAKDSEESPIANSEQPVEPVRVFEYKTSQTKPKKVFSQKPKTVKQRKTVTVKKRVTK